MQISKPVKFSRRPGTGSQQYSKRNSSLNWGLIWSFHYSSAEEIIEIITEIKFAIINLLIHSWQERLTCFDCNFMPIYMYNTIAEPIPWAQG